MFSTYHHMTHNFQGCFRKYLQLHKMSNLLQILSIPPFISPLSLSLSQSGVFPGKILDTVMTVYVNFSAFWKSDFISGFRE